MLGLLINFNQTAFAQQHQGNKYMVQRFLTLQDVTQHFMLFLFFFRKRYVNPYDRATSVEAAAEIALEMSNNNTSLSSR